MVSSLKCSMTIVELVHRKGTANRILEEKEKEREKVSKEKGKEAERSKKRGRRYVNQILCL